MKKKTVCVIGLGYIGLPSAALLANVGYQVVGVDLNEKAVGIINQGKVHIVEPDLDAFVSAAVTKGRFKAYSTPQAGDIYMICVPTPFHEDSEIPSPNIDFVLEATRSIAKFLKDGDLVILESTSPVGTTEEMQLELQRAGVDLTNIHLAHCPERVLPGKIITELVENDRVVGGLTPQATKVAADFYRTFVRGQVLETKANVAEMCKLVENSFRDVNIAFANELSMICAKEGINVWELIQLANRHPRVNILQPGSGVGGHCIAVDPWFIVSKSPETAKLIRKAREVNLCKTEWVIEQIKEVMGESISEQIPEPKLICLGLAFKPDIDDLRESPAVRIVQMMQKLGYNVEAVEPNIEEHEHIKITTLDEALSSASVIVVLVKHRQFTDIKVLEKLRQMKTLDFCGIFN